MDNLLNMSVMGLVAASIGLGLLIGFGLAKLVGRGKPEKAASGADEPNWWELRKTLTGTQLQILQFMEGRQHASITELQEKFEFIPDRELYYRLEQIVLLQFASRGRELGEVVYHLNPAYQGTVEDDKTVMIST